MNITKLPLSEPVLLIKDFFTDEEKNRIVKEIEFLCVLDKLLGADHTGTARDEITDEPKKRNTGLFLDTVYNIRECSDILNLTKKYFSNEMIDAVERESFYFKLLKRSNTDSTLLSYYENSDHYRSHEDQSEITIITYYWKTPKMFTGGNLSFTDYNYTVELEPWDVIVFPSFMNHEVSKVEMLPGVQKNKLNGRVALSTFVSKRG